MWLLQPRPRTGRGRRHRRQDHEACARALESDADHHFVIGLAGFEG